MTRQQDADAMLEEYWREQHIHDAGVVARRSEARETMRREARRQAARDLRAGMIRDAVACALVFAVIGAAFLFPWGAL
jgi:hypothetical protein